VTPLSYWHDSLEPGDVLAPRRALAGDCDVDVAIVGAGFSGLWAAYYLLRNAPGLGVAVVEAETAGFGASGRNGGWCVGDQYGALDQLEQVRAGGAHDTVREMQRSVDEVGRVASEEGIDCGFVKSGAIYVATNPWQLRRARRLQQIHEHYGLGDTYRLLSPRETTAIVNAASVQGSVFNPHAAAIHPARLARGLAVAVERRGGVVYEQTRALAIEPGKLRTTQGTVRAPHIIRCTEAYTSTLDGMRREIVPLANYVIATDVIDDATWRAVGLADRELFEIMVPMVAYGQRTMDGRLVIGGLGAPYRWGSAIPGSPMTAERPAARLRTFLTRTFPVLGDVGVTHHWGGILGVPRDIRPSVGLDRSTGLGWAGGYVGSGVASSNAAGRTLADLVLGVDSDLVRLPWVGHRSPRWEREPLRWIGISGQKLRARAISRAEQHRLRRNRPGGSS
jgi:glycine/D-amino acid oxidase-like deaminating enzyme